MSKVISRQYLFNLSLGFFACVVLTFSFIRESQQQVNRKLGVSNPDSSITNPSEESTPIPVHSNYMLPHPGILPTNPFYLLKMIRDRIGLMTTTEPDQHALLLLHYADKRLSAALTLAKLGREEQAIETVTKGEAYLLTSIYESPKVTENYRSIWFDTLKRAILKHEEILEEMNQTTSEPAKNQINRLHQNLDLYRTQIVSFSGEPFGYSRPEDNLPMQISPATPSAIPTTEPYM
jgi:hypothetical protein